MRIGVAAAGFFILAALGCVERTPRMPDAGRASEDAGLPVPECRPLSENPTCEGDCSAIFPRCPPGYAVICASDISRWEMIEFVPGGPAACDVTYDGSVEPCAGGALPTCTDGRLLTCFPPDEGVGCGFTCIGWFLDGCR
jgi:hypothetical protein